MRNIISLIIEGRAYTVLLIIIYTKEFYLAEFWKYAVLLIIL